MAAEWAEVVYQANSLPANDYHQVQPDLAAARQTLDDHFWNFVQTRYRAVSYYQDNKGPISLMAVNPWFSRQVDPKNRLALLCFDGLAMDQWLLLRDYLQSVLPDLTFHENRTYAIAPTITPISRQALFAGRPPTAFAETLNQMGVNAVGYLTLFAIPREIGHNGRFQKRVGESQWKKRVSLIPGRKLQKMLLPYQKK